MKNGLLLVSLLCGLLLLPACANKSVEATQNPNGSQFIQVTVMHGYQPDQIMAKAGQPLTLEFYRMKPMMKVVAVNLLSRMKGLKFTCHPSSPHG